MSLVLPRYQKTGSLFETWGKCVPKVGKPGGRCLDPSKVGFQVLGFGKYPALHVSVSGLLEVQYI